MEWLKRAAESVRKFLGNLTAGQKIAIATLVVLIVGAIVWMSTSVGADGWTRIAGTEISREERDQILKKLQEKNIKYELRNEEVYVPKESADQTVLELHGEGLFSDVMLWKFLDESNITASKWQQEKRYQVALQRKLQKMIESIKTIRRASVQLVAGDRPETLAFSQAKPPSASVTVELKPGAVLTTANVRAIAWLVAKGSMTGMEPQNVLIMDTSGNAFRIPAANSAYDLAENRLDMERQYAELLKDQIRAIYPNAMVGLRTQLTAESTRDREEIAGKPITKEEETREEIDKSKTGAGAVGVKGEAPEVPSGAGGTSTDKNTKEGHTVNLVPMKIREIETPGGVLKGFSVSVVLPVEVGENENAEEALKKEEGKLADTRRLLMNAVMLADESLLSVRFVATRKPGAIPEPPFSDRLGEILQKWGGSVILLILVVAALIIGYRLLRKAIPKGGIEDLEALRLKVAEEAAVPVTPEGAVGEQEIGRMRQSIREAVQKSPSSGAAILKQWMAGK